MTSDNSPYTKNRDGSPSTWKASSLALLRLLVYTRFSTSMGMALIFIGVLPWLFSNPTITSVYIQTTPLRMGMVALISFLAAAMVVMSFRTTLFNAAARFDDPEMDEFAESTDGWFWLFQRFSWYAIGLPLTLSSLLLTIQETQIDPALPSSWLYFAAALIGVSLSCGILVVLSWVHRAVVTPNVHDPRFFPFYISRERAEVRSQEWRSLSRYGEAKRHPLRKSQLAVARGIARALASIGCTSGYLEEKAVWVSGEPDVRREQLPTVGHIPLALLTAFLLSMHVLVLKVAPWTFHSLGWIPSDRGPFGAMFFLVGVLMVIVGVMPGIAFFLDRFRVPTSWLIAGVVVCITCANRIAPGVIVDHAYPVAPRPHYSSRSEHGENGGNSLPTVVDEKFVEDPLSLKEVIDGWAWRQKVLSESGEEPNRTFVVVTAAGGGIQASGWTSSVLAGLCKSEETVPLVGGIGIVSCVSGGSVGILQFLTRYPEIMDAIAKEDHETRDLLLDDVLIQSTRSSLEAVGWGLLFPDTWRNIGLVRDPTYDRGWVQEQVWADRMNLYLFSDPEEDTYIDDWRRSDWRLGHLAYRVSNGELPAVVFNGFSTTTGQRTWMAPFQIRDSNAVRHPMEYIEFSSALGMQLRLATAARVSASFPYVSPTSIAFSEEPDLFKSSTQYSSHILMHSHLADGGYTDNEGLLTAIELIMQLDAYFESDPDTCPFDRVLLLRIAPFPSLEKIKDEATEFWGGNRIRKDSPYLQGVAGPALGLYRGRVVTQLERGDLELRILENFFDLRTEVHEELNRLIAELNFSGDSTMNENVRAFEMNVQRVRSSGAFALQKEPLSMNSIEKGKLRQGVKSLRFEHRLIDFRLPEGDLVGPPLSWKLDHQQVLNLSKAWKNWQDDKSLTGIFDPSGGSEEGASGRLRSDLGYLPSNPVQSLPRILPSKGAPNIVDLERAFRGD